MAEPCLQPTRAGLLEVIDDETPGRSRGPPVVMLHHGFGTAHSMAGTAADLVAAGHRVIRYSRPGCGASPPREAAKGRDYLEREADTVAPALLDALGIGRASFVGHSDGATIALLLAAFAPARTLAVAAIAPHVLLEPEMIEGIRRFDRQTDGPDFRQRLARRHVDPAFAYETWRDAWLSGAFAGWTMAGELARIEAPLLLVQGDRDEFGSLRHLDEIEKRATGAVRRMVLPGVGHFPYREARAAVSRALVAFLIRGGPVK